MSDGVILICALAHPDAPVLIEGTTRDQCSRCQRAVRIAPSGREVVAKKGGVIVCPDCALVVLSQHQGSLEFKSTKAQAKELRRFLGEDA